jgi:hypothetical protein
MPRPALGERLDIVVDGRQAEAVAVRDRDVSDHATTGPDERGNAGGRDVIEGERAPEQRAPGKQDRHLVGKAGELDGRALDSGDDEQGVVEAAAADGTCRAARRLGQGRGVGVETDDERRGLAAGEADRGPAVAGTDVDDDSLGAGEPGGDLADVDLGQASTDHGLHARESTLPP